MTDIEEATARGRSKAPIHLNGICVCVNYSDFLAYTLPINRHLFESIVVVTDTKDTQTKLICEMLRVNCIPTDVFYKEGAKFCKGAGVNKGLDALDIIVSQRTQFQMQDEWYVQFDADILFPVDFKERLSDVNLQSSHLYGCDRWMVNSFKEAQPTLSAFLEGKPMPPHTFTRGHRVEQAHVGYIPIGFFQLWNPLMSGVHRYPEKKEDASSDDVHFAYNWPRERRHRIHDLNVYHLDSGNSVVGANWKGRTTKRFTW